MMCCGGTGPAVFALLMLTSVPSVEAQVFFTAQLGSKNGVTGGEYSFRVVKVVSRSGRYSDRMIEACKKVGMKPVCDHRHYCKNDKGAVYIGQTHHLAYRPHRNNNNYMPSGFAPIRDRWNLLCSYTRNANGNYALCNVPVNTHAWRNPGQYDPGFVCAGQGSFGLTLDSFNGVLKRTCKRDAPSALCWCAVCGVAKPGSGYCRRRHQDGKPFSQCATRRE
jgi:hypothetical protein